MSGTIPAMLNCISMSSANENFNALLPRNWKPSLNKAIIALLSFLRSRFLRLFRENVSRVGRRGGIGDIDRLPGVGHGSSGRWRCLAAGHVGDVAAAMAPMIGVSVVANGPWETCNCSAGCKSWFSRRALRCLWLLGNFYLKESSSP